MRNVQEKALSYMFMSDIKHSILLRKSLMRTGLSCNLQLSTSYNSIFLFILPDGCPVISILSICIIVMLC